MSFGEVMGLLVVVGGVIAIFGMLTEAYKARMEMMARKYEALAVQGKAEAGNSSDRLEARLRVLERIATDKTAKLSAEIEDLREPAN